MSDPLRNTKDRIVGIIGGMGPLATVELFRRIVLSTPATVDQEHVHIIIDNDPRIPDRTAAILGHGHDPLNALLTAARRLEHANASFLVMPCNTAHHWLSALQECVGVPILDMIALTVQRIRTTVPSGSSIGLLSTEGTVAAGMYQEGLASSGYGVLLPSEKGQAIVTAAIYDIKAGEGTGQSQLLRITDDLMRRGAKGVILGCTELSLLESELQSEFQAFDPLQILTDEVIRRTRTPAQAPSEWT